MMEQPHATQRALEVLRSCVTPQGFVATAEERDNYRRVWARDACVVGLGVLATEDAGLRRCLAASLRSLARAQGPGGQLPSNVSLDGSNVSYGGRMGRIDATLWFVLGACLLDRLCPEQRIVPRLWPTVLRAVEVLTAWEHNARGLIYVPPSGDWADEYLLHGYLLYDQLLYHWARCEALHTARRHGLADPVDPERLRRQWVLLEASHWPEVGGALADPVLKEAVDPERRYFLAGYNPAEVHEVFDALGNALACLLGLGRPEQRRRTLQHAQQLSRFDLVPAFSPPIERDDPRFAQLRRLGGQRVRNQPGRYHNGGLWPMVTGFWAAAATVEGAPELAHRWQQGVAACLAPELGCCEYRDAGDGAPGGTRGQAWSASALLLAGASPAVLQRLTEAVRTA